MSWLNFCIPVVVLLAAMILYGSELGLIRIEDPRKVKNFDPHSAWVVED